MKILDVRWFNKVGIVKVDDEYSGVRYYIRHIEGQDEVHDKQMIAYWGNSFPNDAGDVLFS